MNSSKLIDISKSSIVGLKAELLRKQEEVKRLKKLQLGNVTPEIIQKKKSVQQKPNEDIERRREKNTETTGVDYDALQKSREILEAKSRLYDKLKFNIIDEETKSKYLIDFDLKREIEKEAPLKTAEDEGTKHSENEEDYSDSNSDTENDWVDFVDTLGRSRRCLRKDLREMRAKDAKLAATLRPPTPPQDTTPSPTPELLSWDIQREMMRRKWEEQETLLLGKKDIHYQDVRFDEARPHGVGYFEFSTDEAERARQQEELQKLRTQTEKQQEAAQGLRARRQQQLQARLAAARQRRRERLGLPPESPPHDEAETPTSDKKGEEKDVVDEESIADLEESVKKIAPIRPWDIGKNGVLPVMSQEEWVEKKRQERPAEFAPPCSLIETRNLEDSTEQKRKLNPNIFTTKKEKQKEELFSVKRKRKIKKSKLKKQEEIGPPEDMEDNEEGSFGPFVKDWLSASQQNCTFLSDNMSNKTSNLSTQECSKSTSVYNNSVECKTEDIPVPSVNEWKPTITDIDLLLLKSRAAGFGGTLEEANRNHRLSRDTTILSKTEESTKFPSSVQTENTVKHVHTISSSKNFNVVKIRQENYENPSVDSQRTNHQKGSIKSTNESFDNFGNSETVIKPIVNLVETHSDDEIERSSEKCEESNTGNKWKTTKRKFAEIPPPPSMSYYTDVEKINRQKSSTQPQLADSISAGINYLKSQTEQKNKKRLKGMLDII